MIDVDSIQNFYNSSLGSVFKSELNSLLSRYLDDVQIGALVCLGYNEFNRKVTTMIPATHGLVKGSVCTHETSLALATGSIDCLVVMHLIEHVNDVDKVLKEVYRVLKVGGTAVFVVPNMCSSLVCSVQQLQPGKLMFLFKAKLKNNCFVVSETVGVLSVAKNIPPIVSVLITTKATNSTGEVMNPVFSALKLKMR